VIYKEAHDAVSGYDPEDFKVFNREVSYWVDALNLNDWQVLVSATYMAYESAARCSWDLEAKTATIFYNKGRHSIDIDLGEYNACILALHEVLELLLQPASELTPDGKEDASCEATHTIIHRLTNFLLPIRMKMLEEAKPPAKGKK
jgi:hypothetical protein